jgi:glycosyltransferase involved in cell wall biosynthesis
MTYNHARFIEQAVESALAQELQGRHEILIADDCSTDGTRQIVQGYADRYPETIRLLLLEQNVGVNSVRAWGAQAARGAYVALLDGDDYWTSTHKLQTQVEFLDSHPEYAVCFHNATVVYDDGSSEPHPFHSDHPRHRVSSRMPSTTSTLEDLAVGNFMTTSTVMFRNGLITAFPSWYFEARQGLEDWPFHILNAEHGLIGYIDATFAAYRVHRGGLWSDRMSHRRDPDDIADMIRLHDAINRHLGFRYDERTRERTGDLAGRTARLLAQEGRFAEAAAYARRSLAEARNLKGIRTRLRLEVLARPRLALRAQALISGTRRAAQTSQRAAARLFR